MTSLMISRKGFLINTFAPLKTSVPSDSVSAKECIQFSVIPVFSRASAGDRSRLAGIGGQKMKRTQARLWKFAF
jgi:hypothetical protein